MKHVYFGNKLESSIEVSHDDLRELKIQVMESIRCNDEAWVKAHSNHILESIKTINKNEYNYYINIKNEITEKEVFIVEKYHSHINNVGDNIKIGEYEGKITSKKYDVENNVVYYYTSINVERVEKSKDDIDFVKEEVLNDLFDLLGKCNRALKNIQFNNKEKVEKNKQGFLGKLFKKEK